VKLWFLALFASLAWLPALAPALSAERYPLESKYSLKTTLVPPPLPDGQKLELDVDQAIFEIEARQRADDLIRELVLTPRRRPDLEHDVVQGIQSLNLNEALRRR